MGARAQGIAGRQSLAALAEQVEAPRESVPIVVFNALNWERSDLVRAHVSFYTGVDGKRDIFPSVNSLIQRPTGTIRGHGLFSTFDSNRMAARGNRRACHAWGGNRCSHCWSTR